MQSITKVSESEITKDLFGLNHKLVEFQKIKDEWKGKAILKILTPLYATHSRRLVCYEGDTGYLEPIGTVFPGDIVQREVYPYSFLQDDKVTSTNMHSVVVFGNSKSELFPYQINKAFEKAGHVLLRKEVENFTLTK